MKILPIRLPKYKEIKVVSQNKSVIFVSILILASILRLLNINKELSNDEENIYVSLLPLSNIVPELISHHVYPPLTYFLLHFWTYISGSDAWIRFYFILFGIGSCVVVWFIGKEYIDKRFGLIAFFISACSPFLILMSGCARSYIDSCFFICLSTLFFMRIFKGEGNRFVWCGYFFSILAGFYMFYFTAIVVVAQNIYFLFRVKRYKHLVKDWMGAQAVLALCFIPGLLMFFNQLKNGAEKGLSPYIQHLGLTFLGIRLGDLVRTLASVMGGLDPYLMDWSVTRYINKDVLAVCSVCFLVLISFLFYIYYRSFIKGEYVDNCDKWMFSVLVIGVLLIVTSLNRFMPFATYYKYHTATHIFFIFVFASFARLYSNKLVCVLLAVYLCFGAYRYTEIYRPDFEYKRAAKYLIETNSGNSGLISFEEYFGGNGIENHIDIIRVDKYFYRDKKSGNYLPISRDVFNNLEKSIQPYNDVYVYIHGMIEPYDPYKHVEKFLAEKGYHLDFKKKYHGVTIKHYKY